jgi:DNA-binding NarL/FixJ family response regulator
MALVMVAWVPFWVYEVLNHRLITSPYIFGLIWSFLSLTLAVRHFFQPPALPGIAPASPGPLADGAMLDRFAEARKLTPRERELCGLLVEGKNHADIAEQLFIAEKTVRNHVSNIYAKVGVSSRMELIHSIRAA